MKTVLRPEIPSTRPDARAKSQERVLTARCASASAAGRHTATTTTYSSCAQANVYELKAHATAASSDPRKPARSSLRRKNIAIPLKKMWISRNRSCDHDGGAASASIVRNGYAAPPLPLVRKGVPPKTYRFHSGNSPERSVRCSKTSQG